MKVAYLLVTTAWLTGAQAPATPSQGTVIQPAPAPHGAPVIVQGDCGTCNNGCNTCDTGCGGFLSRCRDFMGRLFNHGGCGFSHCAPSCAPTCAPTCAPACNTCQPSCNLGCNLGGCSGLLSGFRDFCSRLFSHGHNNCDPCCNGGTVIQGGCGTTGTIVSPKGAELIPAPKDDGKKMPPGPGTEPPKKDDKQVQNLIPTNPAPVAPPSLDVVPAAPAIAPARPGDDRPF